MSVYDMIQNHLLTHDSVNVIIAGPTCSGKTTLAGKIQRDFSDRYPVTVVSQDDYFKDLKDIPKTKFGYLTDSIDAFHTTEFCNDVRKLLTSGVVVMPQYDVSTNTRTSKSKSVEAGKINIFEGLHTIHLLSRLDNGISIYISTDMSVCLARRIARDTSKYGVPERRIRQYWNDCIRPMCEKYIFTQRDLADVILNCEDGELNDS